MYVVDSDPQHLRNSCGGIHLRRMGKCAVHHRHVCGLDKMISKVRSISNEAARTKWRDEIALAIERSQNAEQNQAD